MAFSPSTSSLRRTSSRLTTPTGNQVHKHTALNQVLPEEQYILCIYAKVCCCWCSVSFFIFTALVKLRSHILVAIIYEEMVSRCICLCPNIYSGMRVNIAWPFLFFMLLICSIFPLAWLSVLFSFFLYTLFLPPAAAGLHSGFLLIRILIGIIYQRT